jgi:hypothetical protein
MAKDYDFARMAISDLDPKREIPVLSRESYQYSGFHQGSGEITMAELLRAELPQYGLVLIDEVESSVHPRVQRRLMRDLAEVARTRECQIILTTHSPYVLEELPLSDRIYILENSGRKEIVYGVSPQFAMTKMDDEQHLECEVYVEDVRAQVWLAEILSRHAPDIFVGCAIIPYGAANLGVALGQMVHAQRFRRPTVVFLDGDQSEAPGCSLLPGEDAPERVVFGLLEDRNWLGLSDRISRDLATVSDGCARAMTLADHHEWVKSAANELRCGGDVLWQAMSAEWADAIEVASVQSIIDGITDSLR